MSDNAASDTTADNSATNSDNAPKNEDNATVKPEIDWKSESRKWENRAKENRRAANEHGISADLIRGNTEDEINAHAAAIAKALHDAKPSVAPVVPQAGATPDNNGGNLSEFARNVFAGD